jgi:hypothetical protein
LRQAALPACCIRSTNVPAMHSKPSTA